MAQNRAHLSGGTERCPAAGTSSGAAGVRRTRPPGIGCSALAADLASGSRWTLAATHILTRAQPEAFFGTVAFGTQFVIDPKRQMAAVMMINQRNQFDWCLNAFRTLVYQALA